MRPLIVVSPERREAWLEMLAQDLTEKTLLLGSNELGGS
jgi:hypothetical protein